MNAGKKPKTEDQLLLALYRSTPRSESAQRKDSQRKARWQNAHKLKLNAKRRLSRSNESYRLQRNLKNAINRARIKAQQRVWHAANPEKQRQYATSAYQRKPYSYHRARKTNKFFACILRARLNAALSGRTKSASTLALLGCPIDLLKLHLQSQFTGNMQWNNYGTLWQIDHIKPCSSFDLSDPAQQRACFHYSNLQPLLAVENRRKGSQVLA